MPTIQTIRINPVHFKLRRPFVTAAGRKTETDNVQVVVYLSDDTIGMGEASSSIAMPSQNKDSMIRVLKELIHEVRERQIDDFKSVLQSCWRRHPYYPTAISALENALIDAYCKVKRQPLYKFLGGKTTAVETDLTFSVARPPDLFKRAQAAMKKGFRRFKIKLAGDRAERDAERVIAVHRAAPKARLLADGNQGLNASQATEFISRLTRAGIQLDFFEQPFPKHDLPVMRAFRKRHKVPLLADESVLSASDAIRVLDSGAADGVVVKLAKSGLISALDIVSVARRLHKKLAIGCMEESKLGLAASVHLACGVGDFDWIDLDSVFMVDEPPLRGGFKVSGPRLSVAGITAGIGM
jgi:L-alanine-DL-glutamate epimerase-like enolase superfamily enzyme